MKREESISKHTMNWSKAHIPGLEADAAQVPREEAVVEGGNTEDEIDQFTHVLKNIP